MAQGCAWEQAAQDQQCPALLRPVRVPLFSPPIGLIGPSSSNVLSPESSLLVLGSAILGPPSSSLFCIFSPHCPLRHDTPHPLHPVTHVFIQNVCAYPMPGIVPSLGAHTPAERDHSLAKTCIKGRGSGGEASGWGVREAAELGWRRNLASALWW